MSEVIEYPHTLEILLPTGNILRFHVTNAGKSLALTAANTKENLILDAKVTDPDSLKGAKLFVINMDHIVGLIFRTNVAATAAILKHIPLDDDSADRLGRE